MAPSSMSARGERTGTLAIVFGIAWFLSYFAARGILGQTELPFGLRLAAALLPVPLFGAFLVYGIRSIAQMDELERRIQLEALVVAFPLTLLLLMTLGLLDLVVTLSPDDWSYRHVWAMLPMFYFAGIVFARRRYA